MAQVTDWIKHLTTDVDSATEGVQVADIYPMVGTEWMWLTVAIIFWLCTMQDDSALQLHGNEKS